MLGSGSRKLGCDISDTKKSVVVRVWGYGLGWGCRRWGLKGKGNRKKKSSRILEKPRLEYHWGQIPGRGSNQLWFVLIVQITLNTGLRVILLSNLEHWEAHLNFWKKREQSMEHFKVLTNSPFPNEEEFELLFSNKFCESLCFLFALSSV